jgi:predicted AAA+ superfamily ATPase
MLPRHHFRQKIEKSLRRSRVTALIGPRQCGKTTLAREWVEADSLNYFDLENPRHLARLDEPMTALESLKGIVVIDEIQRRPDLFPVLRVLVDRPNRASKFMLLGSASPTLLQQASESLTGRIEFIEMSGFTLEEVGGKSLSKHWLRGGFPPSFLARNNEDSFIWREMFIRSFIERDLPQMGITIAPIALLRFWTMLAHYHGQIWKATEPARSINVNDSSSRRYLDVLTNVFMTRQLQPWFENISKRQVKAPKVYLRDSGLLHHLLGIRTERELLLHPKSGASWEGYVLEETLRAYQPDQAYFWATHSGAELDLLMFIRGKRIGIEFKRMDAPKLSASMKISMEDLKLNRLLVIYPGSQSYRLAQNIEVVPLHEIANL